MDKTIEYELDKAQELSDRSVEGNTFNGVGDLANAIDRLIKVIGYQQQDIDELRTEIARLTEESNNHVH